jgi:hypothetical protein
MLLVPLKSHPQEVFDRIAIAVSECVEIGPFGGVEQIEKAPELARPAQHRRAGQAHAPASIGNQPFRGFGALGFRRLQEMRLVENEQIPRRALQLHFELSEELVVENDDICAGVWLSATVPDGNRTRGVHEPPRQFPLPVDFQGSRANDEHPDNLREVIQEPGNLYGFSEAHLTGEERRLALRQKFDAGALEGKVG